MGNYCPDILVSYRYLFFGLRAMIKHFINVFQYQQTTEGFATWQQILRASNTFRDCFQYDFLPFFQPNVAHIRFWGLPPFKVICMNNKLNYIFFNYMQNSGFAKQKAKLDKLLMYK